MSDPARRSQQRALPECTTDLRLDRRLIGRRGWIDPKTLERELASLSDVADKIQPTELDEPPPSGDKDEGDGGSADAPGRTSP